MDDALSAARRGDRLRAATARLSVAPLLPVLLAVPVLVASRLPLLLSGRQIADADECIVGLMALSMSRGEGLVAFFPGQRYGLAGPEAGLAALAFTASGGPSVVALKAAMLAVWACAGLFVVMAAGEAAGRRGAWLALGAFAACPAWALWATKARGGYMTALLLTAVTAWLAARSKRRPCGGVRAALLGGLAAMLALAQPLFAPAAFPYVAVAALRERRLANACWLAAGAAVVLAWAAGLERREHWSPSFFSEPRPLTMIAALPRLLVPFLSGNWPFDESCMGTAGAIAGFAWLAALAGAPFLGPLAARPARPLFVASSASVGLALVTVIVATSEMFAFRYLLPLTPGLILLLALVLDGLSARRHGGAVAAGLALLLLASGCAAIAEAGRAECPRDVARNALLPGDIESLVDHLRARGIRHVYCLDPTPQWNVMFETGGAILARRSAPRDRLPEIPRAVDAAFLRGEPTALVGRWWARGRLEAALRSEGRDVAAVSAAGPAFVVVEQPDAALLESLGFQFARD